MCSRPCGPATRVWVCLYAVSLLAMGCAQGLPMPLEEQPGASQARVVFLPGTPGVDGVAGGAAPAPVEIAPLAQGDACQRGETDLCLCDATATEGERPCMADASSPLDGFFGACGSCAEPEPVAPAAAPAPAPTAAGPAGGCLANPTLCSGTLACCRADGVCGLGLPNLCL